MAARATVSLVDLTSHTLICLPRGTGIRSVFDRACAARGLAAEVALQASAPPAVADLAVRGLGVAILSETTARAHDGLRELMIEDAREPALLLLAWRHTVSPALSQFLDHARQTFRADG